MSNLNIAKALLEKRKEKGITQNELAQYIGVSKASVSKWETGQSYPDIKFLPELATYFNISVDQLIGYEPQMAQEDIRKLYHKLAKDFAEQPFNQVINSVMEITKKYYSCFPLLLYMGQLLLNNAAYAKAEERAIMVDEAINLFVRVKTNSKDIAHCKQANAMESTCYLMRNQPEKAIDILGDSYIQMLDEGSLLATAYAMNSQLDEAREVLQIGVYQHLLSLLENLMALLQQDMKDEKKSDEIIKRLTVIVQVFNLEKLHPVLAISVYVLIAQNALERGDTDGALIMLQKYCDLAINQSYPMKLHGDEFFDKIEKGWLSTLDMGTDIPLNEKMVKLNMLNGIVLNPAFAGLAEDYKFKCIVEKLSTVLGG